MQDHEPFAHAFNELDLITFIELLEAAADYFDAFHRADDAEVITEDESEDEPEDDGAEDVEVEDAGETEAESEDQTTAERLFQLALAQGFMLKTKADGWKLFCERMNIPPFAIWQFLPGFDRLQRALKMAERAAFVPEGMVRWLNAVRPEGEPETKELKLTPEKCAEQFEALFRQRVEWWGG